MFFLFRNLGALESIFLQDMIDIQQSSLSCQFRELRLQKQRITEQMDDIYRNKKRLARITARIYYLNKGNSHCYCREYGFDCEEIHPI
jgi:hypothetical protein